MTHKHCFTERDPQVEIAFNPACVVYHCACGAEMRRYYPAGLTEHQACHMGLSWERIRPPKLPDFQGPKWDDRYGQAS